MMVRPVTCRSTSARRRILGLRRLGIVGVAAVSAVGLSGCASSSGDDATTTSTTATTGSELQILTAYPDYDAAGFASTLKRFEESTGIKVRVRGAGGNFVDQLYDPAVQGQIDVAVFPQPGVMATMARAGKLVPIQSDLVAGAEAKVWPALAKVGEVDGVDYAIPVRAWVSLGVIYRSDIFAANGWTYPTTWQGLDDLTAKIRASGTTPWCIGAGAGGATGWALTTLVEEYVNAHGGAQPATTTGDWIAHKRTANDPVVKAGIAWVAKLMQQPKWSTPTGMAILSTPVERSHDPLFADPPGCVIAPAYNFIASGYPKNWESMTEFAQFPLADGTSRAVRGGPDLAAAFNKDEDTQKFMEFLATTKDYGIEWARTGGYFSPDRGVAVSNYPGRGERFSATVMATAGALVPDATDSMPAEVGSASYWKGLSSLANKKTSLQKAIATIEGGWAAEAAAPDTPGSSGP